MILIVDIPDETYNRFMDDWVGSGDILHAVRRGTPLPKGNMRLINANELLNNLSNTAVYDDDYYYSIVYHAINYAPTIIEYKGDN